MSRGKVTSSKDRAKVIEAKVNNPDLSTRDLEKATGINRETNRKIIKEDLPNLVSSSDTIKKLVDDNNKIMNLTGNLVMQKLAEGEKVSMQDINKARDLAFKQNELTKALEGDGDKEIVVKFEM